MKKLFLTLLLGIFTLLQTPAILSAQNFEGIIYYEIPEMTKQGMGNMPYMVKDNKVRMEFGEGNQKGALLLLPEESQMTFILDAMQGYMTMDLDEQYQKTDDSGQTPEVTKTGVTKTIAGKTCEVWNIKTEENTVEACLAKGMGSFMMPKTPMARSNSPKWAQELMEGNSMPLEVIEIKNGKKTVQMRATKIEEKSLSADLFEIPKGYNNMSGMMKQMMNRNRQ